MTANIFFTLIILITIIPIYYAIYNRTNNERSISTIVTDQNGNHKKFFLLMSILGFITIQYEKLRKNKLSYYAMCFIIANILILCFFHPKSPCHTSYASLAFFAMIIFMIIHMNKANILKLFLTLELIAAAYLLISFPKVFYGQVGFIGLFILYYCCLHFIDN